MSKEGEPDEGAACGRAEKQAEMLRKKTPIGKLEEQPNVHPAQEKVKVLYGILKVFYQRTLCPRTQEVSTPRLGRLGDQGGVQRSSRPEHCITHHFHIKLHRGPEPTRYGDWERKGRVSDF